MFCRQQVAELEKSKEEFDRLKVRLAVIGSGDRAHFPSLRKATGYSGELFSDPERASYQLFGFPSGVGKVVGLKALSRAISALKAGHTPGSLQGSALQLGGAAVVATDGEVLYLYRGREAGDHPDPADMLQVLTQRP